MSDNVEDMSKSRKEETGKDGRSGIDKASAGAQKAKNAAKTAKKAAKAAKTVKSSALVVKILALAWPAIIVLVILFLLIGVAGFITSVPGLLMDKITEITSGLWDGFASFFVGNEAYIHKEDETKLANYLQNMGYDVVGFGFAAPDEVTESQDGNGDKYSNAQSKYLLAYLLADYNTYTVHGNVQHAVSGFFNSMRGKSTGQVTGMLCFDDNGLIDTKTVKADRANKKVTVNVLNPELLSWFNTDSYTFDLEGWTGRYGKPLEFLLTLHIATMAPDLALHVASDEEFDTKVHIGFDDVTSYVRAQYTISSDTVDHLKQLQTTEPGKVIWEIEGLEYLYTKIQSDNTLILQTEDFKKIQEIYNKTYGAYDNFEACIEYMKVFIPYLEKVEAGEEQMPSVLYNTGMGVYYKNPDGGDSNNPVVVTGMGSTMDSFMEEAREGSDATYKADTESYYSDLITPTEAMQSGDTNEAYVKRMREALEKALETAEADLPVMKENSDETAQERNKLVDSLNEIGISNIAAIEQAIDLSDKNDGKGQEIKSVQPYITYVEKSWYKNIYFVINDSIRNAVGGADSWLQNASDFSAYQTESGVTKELSPYEFNPGSNSDQKDMVSGDQGKFEIIETRSNTTQRTQTRQPLRGATNPRIKELLVGAGNQDSEGTNPKPEYYIYDGSRKTAQKIKELKEKEKDLPDGLSEKELSEEINKMDPDNIYRPIDFNKNSLSAFTILENMKSEDADFILRDLKDLLVELKYFKASDLEDKYVGLLDWIIPAYQPEEWPEREFEKQNYEYGTLIKYRENIVKGGRSQAADLDILKISDQDAWERLTNGKISARPQDKATNSDLQNEVDKKIKTITVKIRTWAGDTGLERTDKEIQLQVNEELEEMWIAFFEDLYESAPDFCIVEWGGYRVDGTGVGQVGQKSAHNYGAAVDLNWSQNYYGKQPMTKAEWEAMPESREKYQEIYINSPMVEVAHKYTLSWGGDWTSCKDNMHFSFFADESRDTLIQKWGNGQVIQNTGLSKKIDSLENFLFIGDSYTKGIEGYGYLEECKISAVNGVSPSYWLSNINSLPTDEVKGVCVLLGVNNPSEISQMKQLIDALKNRYSSVPIFVQRVFPVGAGYSNASSMNSRISAFNDEIEKYCEGIEDVTFIDTTKGFIDSEGYLASGATDDNLHIAAGSYSAWIDNIKNKILGSYMGAAEAIKFEDQDVITPGIGEITKISKKSITIKFTETNLVKDMEMTISGFQVDESLKKGDMLDKEQKIGKTLKEDILLILRTANKAVIENIEDYMPPPEIETNEGTAGFVENPEGTDIERWRDIVIGALTELGLDTSEDTVQRVLQQIENESSGDPYCVNDWDSNSSFDCSAGVLQAIASTYNTYKRPEDPEATAFTGDQYRAGNYDKNDPRFNGYYCIYACINYCAQRYGRDLPVWPGGGY